MSDIHLDDQLIKQLEQLATRRSMGVNEFLAETLRSYLRQIEQEAMQENINAFTAQHAELFKDYRNEYVAIHLGKLVDHDKDFQSLHRRVREQYGRQPVLLRLVSTEAEQTLTFRSPRLNNPAQ